MIRSAEESRWRELRTRLAGFVGRRIRNPEDAEDVVQEIFLRMQHNIGSLASADRLDAWAFRIARNAIADYYRAPNRREASNKDTGKLVEGFGAAFKDARSEMAYCIAPMVSQLPDGYREAIELTEFDGLTQAAAAERLGLSVSGMKSRVQRGRDRLRVMLLKCCEIETDRRGRVVSFETRAGEGCAKCCAGQRDPQRDT